MQEETAETPDLGHQAEQAGKVPSLLINSLEKVLRRDSVEDAAKQPDMDTLLKIERSKNPNTDRNIRKDTLNAHNSPKASLQQEQYLDLPGEALNVPMSSWQQGRLRNKGVRTRQLTKDSQSSVLTPIFPKD